MSRRAESTVLALARLARLQNGIIAAAGVVVGGWWGGASARDLGRLGLACLAAVALATFANAFNDWRDVEIDRVVHPARPLPAAALSLAAALRLASLAAGVALAASALLAPGFVVASALVLALMVLYSTHLKRAGLAGNVCVAVLASLPFVYGAWAVGAPRAAAPLFALGVPLHFAREIAKDLDDAPGDRLSRATLPVAHGALTARALFATALVIFLLVLASIVVRRPLLGVLVVPALGLCALAARRIIGGAPGGPRLLKAAMVLAFVPLLLVRP